MRPQKDDETLVDVLDVLLRDGAIVRADVIVSVADIPLVGIKLTAAIAGMQTMNEYGLFEEWDTRRRRRGVTRRQQQAGAESKPAATESLDRLAIGHRDGIDDAGADEPDVEPDSSTDDR